MTRITPAMHPPLLLRQVRHLLMSTLAFAGMSVLGADARASVYKCVGEGGTPMYQESPCPPGKELRNFDLDPPDISIIPGGAGKSSATKSPADRAIPERSAKDAKTKERAPGGDPALRKHISAGMTEGEVVFKIGRPDVTSGNKQTKSARWTYLPIAGDADVITTISLASGLVTGVERKTVKK